VNFWTMAKNNLGFKKKILERIPEKWKTNCQSF
jgi:hypothetical protein